MASLERLEREEPWVREELDYLDNGQYAEAYGALRKKYGQEEVVLHFNEQYAEYFGDSSGNPEEEDPFDFAVPRAAQGRRLRLRRRRYEDGSRKPRGL
ncbi:hypothetical protein ACFPPD_05160 [Cohnella suwonensis]|uniref:Uncharacterized protein n=1 Tax=Cohnella suwonensis TaxID=696072 RepID=A0ABW0LS54_9BACL